MEFGDAIAQCSKLLMPRGGRQIQLLADYTAGSGTITFDYNSPFFASIQPGALVSYLGNILFIYGVPNQSTGVTSVVGGWNGSTDANIDYDATPTPTLTINARWTEWEIMQAINQELVSITSPQTGIGQILYTDQTFIPIYVGYDLGSNFDARQSWVLEIMYQIAPPYRTNPLIRRGEYRVARNQNNPGNFPSGNGVIITRTAWPGFPIHVQFMAPFSPLVNLTDDLLTVGGVPVSSQDIIVYGAALRIAGMREIARNSYQNQPDARKAPEVPPGAMYNAAKAIQDVYVRRIAIEAAKIKQAYPHAEFVI